MFTAIYSTRLVSTMGALFLLVFAFPVHAVKEGDWLVRGGVAQVSPNDSSGEISDITGAKVGIDSDTGLALTATYMLTDNVGLEFLAMVPTKHDITGKATISGLGKIAETKLFPPTLILLYNFAPQAGIRPYAGAGINYTKFLSEEAAGVIAGTKIDLDSSTGFAAEAGVDIDINKDWFFNASIWHIKIDTTATTALGSVDVEIDPWVFMVGVGTRF